MPLFGTNAPPGATVDTTNRYRWPQAANAQPGEQRRVLLLAYYFPPDEKIAAHRPEALYRYLGEFGWEPTVLTAERPHTPAGVLQTADDSWMHKVEAARQAGNNAPLWLKPEVRRGSGRLAPLVRAAKRLLRLLPAWHDEYTGWSYEMIPRAIAEGRQRKVDLVWATCNPFTTAPAALKIARALQVPCVINLRDPLNDYLFYPRNTSHWFYQAMRSAAAITIAVSACVTPELREVCPDKPFYTILSGSWHSESMPARAASVFTLLHPGTLYGGRRDPRMLFAALATLAAEAAGLSSACPRAFRRKRCAGRM